MENFRYFAYCYSDCSNYYLKGMNHSNLIFTLNCTYIFTFKWWHSNDCIHTLYVSVQVKYNSTHIYSNFKDSMERLCSRYVLIPTFSLYFSIFNFLSPNQHRQLFLDTEFSFSNDSGFSPIYLDGYVYNKTNALFLFVSFPSLLSLPWKDWNGQDRTGFGLVW